MCAGRPRPGHINITAITDMVYYIHSWKYFQKMSIAISFRITYVKWSSSRLFDIEILFCFKDFLLSFFFFYFQLWNLNCQSTFSRLSGSTRRNQIHFWYPNDSIFTTACLPVLQHSLSEWWNKNIYMKLSSAL